MGETLVDGNEQNNSDVLLRWNNNWSLTNAVKYTNKSSLMSPVYISLNKVDFEAFNEHKLYHVCQKKKQHFVFKEKVKVCLYSIMARLSLL